MSSIGLSLDSEALAELYEPGGQLGLTPVAKGWNNPLRTLKEGRLSRGLCTRVVHRDRADGVIRFSAASSFGNFFGILIQTYS